MNSMKNRNTQGKGNVGNIMQVNMAGSMNYNSTQGYNRVPSSSGQYQTQPSNSRSKSVHQNQPNLNPQTFFNQTSSYNNIKNNTQYNTQVANLTGMNKTGTIMNPNKKSGKRSNSDNLNNRKQATKSLEVTQQNTKNQKMAALTNKLSSIYSSNTNMPPGSSQLNQNIGQLIGRHPNEKNYNSISINGNLQKPKGTNSMHSIPVNMQKQMLNKTLNLPNYGLQTSNGQRGDPNDMRQIKRSHSSNNDPDILKAQQSNNVITNDQG